jgi:phosphopantothenoylcysteine decarboxylase/phosphopantothenate--cysteine ligase
MLNGKTVLLGVSGGIAAYKSAELVRLLVGQGASVHVVMTASAQRFVTPLTFQTLSNNAVGTDMFGMEPDSRIGHIQKARIPDLVIVAPATANLMAKMAAGIADDYLTTILLATTAPVLVCPAMNVKMWEHPATRRNLKVLAELGYEIQQPGTGSLACQEEGAGRLAELDDIIESALRMLTPPSLAGRRVLVSAGPTWEYFDPVRFIGNPSSGKMGFALAKIAARRSARVHLVSGPCCLDGPAGVERICVTSAQEMRDVIFDLSPHLDAIVMAAAVSDYRPAERSPRKLKKKDAEAHTIVLEPNADILACLGKVKPSNQALVGFAAETENILENAKGKLVRKNLDFIVANDLAQEGCGFGHDTNQVSIIERNGAVTNLPPMTKEQVASEIWDRIERLIAGGKN